MGLPINFDRKKQHDAPAVALKTTKKIPFTPKRAPASNDMKMVPGIINVCMNM
ncbi:hypothetical protein HanRHA438_Chr11g0485341 [Helianthus annuus]|nr:hypothetical protein HanRHA438_Chr11g0485341 [Helianthus annuus]